MFLSNVINKSYFQVQAQIHQYFVSDDSHWPLVQQHLLCCSEGNKSKKQSCWQHFFLLFRWFEHMRPGLMFMGQIRWPNMESERRENMAMNLNKNYQKNNWWRRKEELFYKCLNRFQTIVEKSCCPMMRTFRQPTVPQGPSCTYGGCQFSLRPSSLYFPPSLNATP